MLSLYSSAAAALGATLFLTFLLRPLARSLDFVDRPGGRKLHAGEVPVVGGLAMFMGLVLGLAMLPEGARPPATFTATAFVFVCLGLLDDRFNLPSALRLCVQVGAVIGMAIVGSLSVQHVGAPFGTGTTIFAPPVAMFVTVMLVVGAVNALNMVDGIDGLAGSMGFIALVAVAVVAALGANVTVLGVAVVLAAAVAGFLVFNLPLGINRPIRVFMGDAGSMLVGFSLAWMMVSLSQDPKSAVAPVTLLWFAAMPIYDMVSTGVGRVLRGESPMNADNSHLHHRLLKKGYSARTTLLILVVLAIFWAITGLALDGTTLPEWVSMLGFLVAGGVTVAIVQALPGQRAIAAPAAHGSTASRR
jgi:UDP-GlcNAc:undecaprenyl-phosphate GlcNAc-1-phosphate transferase